MLIYILIGISIIIIVRAVRQIMVQHPHLTDEELHDFVKMRMDTTSDEYTRFIGHLSGCKACQERLDAAQSNSGDIEKHLV
ncbi:MAG: hypothetical protein ACI97N_001817 [Cognaticolwellia sp.]|jgi:hypothetical protein|tara:strand:+ start:2247 stop:2489 length:243 start_codon:yes stop_codon:yes gene_type:complete